MNITLINGRFLDFFFLLRVMDECLLFERKGLVLQIDTK